MKITHVAEILNIGHVARILEAEICGAENMRAILLYNLRMFIGFSFANIVSQILNLIEKFNARSKF